LQLQADKIEKEGGEKAIMLMRSYAIVKADCHYINKKPGKSRANKYPVNPKNLFNPGSTSNF